MSSTLLTRILCPIWAIGLGVFVLIMLRFRQNRDKRIACATPATATITKVDHSYYTSHTGEIIIGLALKVMPPDGDPYEAKAVWRIKRASKPKTQSGNTVQVRIDAQDRTLIYSAESWAKNY